MEAAGYLFPRTSPNPFASLRSAQGQAAQGRRTSNIRQGGSSAALPGINGTPLRSIMPRRFLSALLALPLLAVVGCGTTRVTEMRGLMAYARLEGPRGVTDGADGLVLFVREGAGIRVTGRVTGLAPGQHGFHVHERGSCSPADSDGDGLEEAAGAAGAHFDPTNAIHGPRTANRSRRHAGDLGNLDADASGIARVAFTDSLITLDGRREIIGRALIIHADRDDLSEDPAGNAGRRISCGVIQSGTTDDLDRLTAELAGMGE